jgi:glycosyltransferase involved in cell wall biosynthesis
MLSIICPVYNEEEILEQNVRQLYEYAQSRQYTFEIIAISNGSTDSTDQIGEKLANELPHFHFFTFPERGVGAAFKIGVKNCIYENVVFLDVDLSSDLKFIDHSIALLQHCDLVVGSKRLGRQNRSITRKLGSLLYISLAQLLFNVTMTDFSPGSKAFKKTPLLRILEHLDDWTGFVFELGVYFTLQNKDIVQIGVDCVDLRKSSFGLIHEATYRYKHLYIIWRKLKESSSWLHLS